MRRALIVTSTVVGLLTISIAAAAMAGVPRIDNADVKISVKPSPAFVAKSCVGETGIKYVTYRGGWRGSESELVANSSNYNLTGPLTVSNVVWTVNLRTLRGVLTGDALLGPSTKPVYFSKGDLTLITQGMPKSKTPVAARGWLDAAAGTSLSGQSGGKILANVELQIQGSFVANGGFGDMPALFNTPSYSVGTINEVC